MAADPVASSLASFIRARREAILREWTEGVEALLASGGPGRTVPLEDLSRALETIADALASGPTSTPTTPRARGLSRLPQGYELSEVVLEYAVLRRAILELWRQEVGLTIQVPELLRLDAALDASIVQSVVRFAQTRERMLVAVDRISMAAIGKSELAPFLQELTRTIQGTSPSVSSAVVFLREGERLLVQASTGVEAAPGASVPLGRSFAGTVAAAAQSSSYRWNPERRPHEHGGEVGVGPGTQALYGVPLLDEGQVLGVLQLASAEVEEFSEEDQLLFRAVANRATTMILQVRVSHERDRALAETQALVEKARQAVAARQDLLTIVSHDLRNPLSTVTLNSEQIRRWALKRQTDDWLKRKADGILVSAGRMKRLVDDLLDLSRLEAGRLLPLELARQNGSELARQALESFQPIAASRGLTLHAELEQAPSDVSCDRDRVHQVLSNLLGNAISFTRAGGTITLRTRRTPAEVIFTIVDTGVGIGDEQVASIFNPYWQGRAMGRGLGLGLSVAKAIVEAHGGRIWVESHVGHGSEFSFALPALQEEPHGPT